MAFFRISGKEICDLLTMSVMGMGVGRGQVCQWFVILGTDKKLCSKIVFY